MEQTDPSSPTGPVSLKETSARVETNAARIETVRSEAFSLHAASAEQISLSELRSIEAFQLRHQNQMAQSLKDKARPVRVAFMLPEITLWEVYAPLYHAMSKSPDFDPIVLAFMRVDIASDKTRETIIAALKNMKVNFEFLEPKGSFYPPLDPTRYDIAFFTLGSLAYPKPYQIEFISQYLLTSYISYGFLMVDELDYQFGQSFHHAAWRIYASTEREETEYSTRTKRLTNNIVTTGYTKFDLYRANIPKPPTRPKIIWAPHWTIGLIYPALRLGTFNDICNEMLALMTERSDIDFVFKPHPNLKFACETTTFMNAEGYEYYLSQLDALPNVTIGLDGDNIPRFLGSSAMITDSVSFLAEYIPSTRPLLFLDRPDRAPFSDAGERIIDAHYRGVGITAIRDFIDRVVDGEDQKLKSRMAAARTELNIGEHTATQNILQDLTEALQLDQDALRKA